MGIEKAESTVELLSVFGILILIAYAAKQISSPLSSATAAVSAAYTNLTQDIGAQVTGPQPWIGTTAALTMPQATGIASFIGISARGGSWKLSPDGTQVWFADGSYYDNPSGHIFSSAGQDMGEPFSTSGQVTSSPEIFPDFSLAM
jgi:hypothetical protein